MAGLFYHQRGKFAPGFFRWENATSNKPTQEQTAGNLD